MTMTNKIYESAGYLQNGIEVYYDGLIRQGSERAAYNEGGNSFDDANLQFNGVIKQGERLSFNVTPSYNSLSEVTIVTVDYTGDVITVNYELQ